MSKLDKKWKRERQASADKSQSTIAPYGKQGYKLKEAPPVTQTYTIDEPVMCPFCLHIGKINEFLLSTKKGFDKRLGQCPECENKMMIRSLTAEWTPEQFAEWVYNYVESGYWQKVKFDKFRERLNKIGWSYRFWTKYKQLKGEEPTESYQKWLERKQREEYEQEQVGEE